MRRILQLSALTLALIGAGGVQATPLSALFVPGASITAGDKVFDQFSVLSYVTGDGRRLNAGNIDVTALNDGGLSPGPGLSFAVSNGELNVTGDGVYNFVDLAFAFHVTAPAGFRIEDNSLDITGGVLGWTANVPPDEDLGMTILEWVSGAPVVDPTTPGYISAEFSRLAGTTTSALTASSQFAPMQDYWITKDILVWSVNQTDTASLQGFTQRFSQIPEPGTLALVAMAMVSALGVSRRRGTAA